MPRKRWTIDEKSRIVMEVLTTGVPLSEICRKYNVQLSQVYKWKECFVHGGTRALSGNNIPLHFHYIGLLYFFHFAEEYMGPSGHGTKLNEFRTQCYGIGALLLRSRNYEGGEDFLGGSLLKMLRE